MQKTLDGIAADHTNPGQKEEALRRARSHRKPGKGKRRSRVRKSRGSLDDRVTGSEVRNIQGFSDLRSVQGELSWRGRGETEGEWLWDERVGREEANGGEVKGRATVSEAPATRSSAVL